MRTSLPAPLLLFFTIISTVPSSLITKPGCMDKSKHAFYCSDRACICCTPDYKTLYYVDCACPCDRYPYIDQYGRCYQCRHYYIPDEYPITFK